MTTHTLTPTCIGVDVPEGHEASLCKVHIADGTPNEHWLSYWPGLGNNNNCFVWIKLPPGTWYFLCLESTMTEEQAGMIVAWFELAGKKGWRDYSHEDPRFPFDTALASYATLKQSLNLPKGERIVLIKK